MIRCGFFNAINGSPAYSADDMNNVYKDMVSDGIYNVEEGEDDAYFKVFSNNNMTVSINPGRAIIDQKWVESDTSETLEIAASSPTKSRIDSVILQINTDETERKSILYIKAGTFADNPVAPEPTNEGYIHEFVLAHVLVRDNTTEILPSDITDTRGTDLAPWVESNLKADLLVQGAASTIMDEDLPVSRALISNTSGKVMASDNVSSDNIETLAGNTYNVQNTFSSLSRDVNNLKKNAISANNANFTAGVVMPKDKYKFNNDYGIDLRNSDLINFNGLYGADTATNNKEGINFYLDGTWWASIWAGPIDNSDPTQGGKLVFAPKSRSTTDIHTTTAAAYEIFHDGNVGNKLSTFFYKNGLDLRNGDIKNFNGMYGNDESTSALEGINFYIDGNKWDSIWARDGKLYFAPQTTTALSNTNKKEVVHMGNFADKLTAYIKANDIDFNNKSLKNFGSMYANDYASDNREGIHFRNNGTDDGKRWDAIWAAGGVLYFAPNTKSDNSTDGHTPNKDAKRVIHTGNFNSTIANYNSKYNITLGENKRAYEGEYVINFKNSDAININALRFTNNIQDSRKGLSFGRSDNGNEKKFDTLWGSNGELYFAPNVVNSASSFVKNSQAKKVAHSGNLGDLLYSGSIVTEASSITNDYKIASGKSKSMGSFELEKGIYVVTITLVWDANAKGSRCVWVSSSSNGDELHMGAVNKIAASPDGRTYQQVTVCLRPTKKTKYYAFAEQNSGGNLNVKACRRTTFGFKE